MDDIDVGAGQQVVVINAYQGIRRAEFLGGVLGLFDDQIAERDSFHTLNARHAGEVLAIGDETTTDDPYSDFLHDLFPFDMVMDWIIIELGYTCKFILSKLHGPVNPGNAGSDKHLNITNIIGINVGLS